MVTIEDRNGMDLTEAEDIKKRWQKKKKKTRRGGKNTQKNCTKKDLHDPDNHDGVITHLEPDILEFKVGLRKHHYEQSGGDGITVKLFQILEDGAVTPIQSICQQIWKTQQWPQDWKSSVFILIPKKGNAKEHSNHHTIALISYASKVMLKIL